MSESLPLFPLTLVIFPGCSVPLHIFEDRYRLMVRECLEDESEFVTVFGSDDSFANIGCAARVTDVVNRFADGRLNIIIQGTDRVQVVDRSDEKAYISGTVERVRDDAGMPDASLVAETQDLYAEVLKLTIGWYRAPAREDESPSQLSYTIASALGMPPDRQQEFLEETSAVERFNLLRDMLGTALSTLREHARKTGGNGKAH